MEEIIQRTTFLEDQIKGLKSINARRDLTTMLKVLERSITELSQESVECRRLHKSTTKYQTLYSLTDMCRIGVKEKFNTITESLLDVVYKSNNYLISFPDCKETGFSLYTVFTKDVNSVRLVFRRGDLCVYLNDMCFNYYRTYNNDYSLFNKLENIKTLYIYINWPSNDHNKIPDEIEKWFNKIYEILFNFNDIIIDIIILCPIIYIYMIVIKKVQIKK
jgi:hypothetical protein